MIADNHERQLLTLPAERLNPSDACTVGEISPAQREWLASAPPDCWIGNDVFVCHGTPRSDLHYWLETVTDDFGVHGSRGVRMASPADICSRLGSGLPAERASLVICGHTHVPRSVQVAVSRDASPLTVVNPGSVGLPACDDVHPFMHCIETGSTHARYALVKKSASGWDVSLRSVPYDVEPMVRLAGERGHLD